MRWLVLLLVPLAGCMGSGDNADGLARVAYGISQDAVDDRYEYALFLGITGTEGDLDWQAYEADLMAQGGQGAKLAEVFDQDVDNGAFGDGRLGAWMTTHFAYDGERRLVGGLFSQILEDGSRKAMLAPFTGPYQGTPSTAQAALPLALRLQEADPILCTLLTDTQDWKLSSSQAAAIALEDPQMQAHMEAYPDGELTYFYFPRLSVDSDCPETLNATSNHWTVMHTDLDRYLAGERPTMAQIVIDAANGTVLERSTGPLFIRAPELLDETIRLQDPVIPLAQSHVMEAAVAEGGALLEWQVYRTSGPERAVNEQVTLRDPLGRIRDTRAFDVPLHRFVIEDPMEGTWTMEYAYQPVLPLTEHVLELRGAVVYG